MAKTIEAISRFFLCAVVFFAQDAAIEQIAT